MFSEWIRRYRYYYFWERLSPSRESGSQHIGVLDLTPVSSELQGFETSINLVVKGAYRESVKFAVKEVDGFAFGS